MIFFSVIIPVYNRSQMLTDTIDTVLRQTYSDFEIIIVDDGSKEDIKTVIDKRYLNEPRIRYFYKQNEERGAARNFGLKHSKGDYTVFFDSDDFMKPHYLETLSRIIIENPDVKLLAAKYNYDDNGIIQHHYELNELKEGWYDQSLFLKGNILACNYCIRIKDHDYKLFSPDRDLASMEDWLFLLANLEQNKIFIRDEICVTMRQHDKRSMSNNQKVIAARKKATAWALNNLDFTPAAKKTIIAWSHYFCGIHEYLDHNRIAAVKEAIKAMREGGLQKKFLILLAKAIVGRKLIRRLK